jgi:hypothetical protein
MQIPLTAFSIVVMWQFLTLSGAGTTENLIPKTFREEEIESAPQDFRPSMSSMAAGVDEIAAYTLFYSLKSVITARLLDVVWHRMSPADREKYAPLNRVLREHDIYINDGMPLSRAHRELLLSLRPFIKLSQSGGK